LTDRQIDLIQRSFEAIRPLMRVATDMFFVRLFLLEPPARERVGSDLDHVKSAIATGVAAIAVSLPAPPDAPVPIAFATEASVRSATMWTLERMLGQLYTAEIADAWWSAILFTCQFTYLSGDHS
jgi:nitric oxide dioxygenase